jgi:hypothetical protein
MRPLSGVGQCQADIAGFVSSLRGVLTTVREAAALDDIWRHGRDGCAAPPSVESTEWVATCALTASSIVAIYVPSARHTTCESAIGSMSWREPKGLTAQLAIDDEHRFSASDGVGSPRAGSFPQRSHPTPASFQGGASRDCSNPQVLKKDGGPTVYSRGWRHAETVILYPGSMWGAVTRWRRRNVLRTACFTLSRVNRRIVV